VSVAEGRSGMNKRRAMKSTEKTQRTHRSVTGTPLDRDYATDLAAVDKLLATAAEMMAGASTLDRAAFEYLRRLRVAVRFAISAEAAQTPTSHKPMKWLERTNRTESAVDFIQREYAGAIADKSITRADIRRLDPPLYTALYAWISKHGDLPKGFDLPKLADANQRKLKAVGKIKQPRRLLKVSEMSAEDREQLRLYKLAQRQRKAPLKS
jgi:hypothetical protein